MRLVYHPYYVLCVLFTAHAPELMDHSWLVIDQSPVKRWLSGLLPHTPHTLRKACDVECRVW